jgi:hypothetical protein
MVVEEALSFAVGIVAASMAVVMLSKFWQVRRLHHILWAIGLFLWAASAFLQGAAILVGWTVLSYKVYYFSAISLAGVLGAGTLGLVTRRTPVVRAFTVYVVVACGVLGVALAFATVNEDILQTIVVGGLALPSDVRLLSPFINIPGGITFIGGALYSIAKTHRMFAVFIFLGATVPALGGTLARFSQPWALPFTDFVGIVFLSAGVYLSLRPLEAPSAPITGRIASP